MKFEKRAELARITVELFGLRQAAVSVGEPFLVHLIDMAMAEAHMLRGGTLDEFAEEASGAAEDPIPAGTWEATAPEPELAGC